MKYVDEYRDGALARTVAAAIGTEAASGHEYRFMEFCGGHTHALWRHGIVDLLPDNVRMVHGPGCPVCVLPMGRIDDALALTERPEVILCSYGDALRVPGSRQVSLLKAKAAGRDIRMVASTLDALALARANLDRVVVFFAIGFETTTPPTALALIKAKEQGLTNFTVFSNHVLTPAAIHAILDAPPTPEGESVALDGFIGPGHVSAVIGYRPYEPFAELYKKPVVISGFEPLDVMQSILMLIRQVNDGRAVVENQYGRAVRRDGNAKAMAMVERAFETRETFEWRGLGLLPDSALRPRAEFVDYDAEVRFQVPGISVADNKACACGPILRGLKKPLDCKLFGRVCTPENPIGACMVSSEGACAAYYSYGRFK
ncbi:Hydrogenase maturation factor HypD [uncultured Gammaproteobacteria bacterium]